MERRALAVGIDRYDHVASLAGAVNDARAFADLRERHGDGSPSFEVTRLFGGADRVTAGTLRKAVEDLFSGARR